MHDNIADPAPTYCSWTLWTDDKSRKPAFKQLSAHDRDLSKACCPADMPLACYKTPVISCTLLSCRARRCMQQNLDNTNTSPGTWGQCHPTYTYKQECHSAMPSLQAAGLCYLNPQLRGDWNGSMSIWSFAGHWHRDCESPLAIIQLLSHLGGSCCMICTPKHSCLSQDIPICLCATAAADASIAKPLHAGIP